MKHLYLALAILGAVAPYVFFTQFFAAEGLALGGFLGALFVNGAAAGITVDLVIASAVFWIVISRRSKLGKGPAPWGFMVLNLLIGLSCALPLYLWTSLRRQEQDQPHRASPVVA